MYPPNQTEKLMDNNEEKKTSRSGSETRKRKYTINIRVSEEERNQLEEDATRAGLTVSSYARRLLLDAPVPRQGKRPHVNREELAKLLGHIGKIGSNINQIARAANSNIPYSQQALDAHLAELEILRQHIRKAMGKS